MIPKTRSFKAQSSKKSKALNSLQRVRIRGEGRNELNERFLKIEVRGSSVEIPPIAVQEIVKNPNGLFSALANAGWNAFTANVKQQLLEKLQAWEPEEPSFEVMTRVGWNGGAFVLPDQIIGKSKMSLELAFDLDPAMLAKYRKRGTLPEWKEKVAGACENNSRLMLAISVSLSGPILRLVGGPKAGGFQLWGPAEAGKTTAIMVGGSVWGCHRVEGRREKGFVESWNSTPGKLEQTSLAHRDTFLPLDETYSAGKDSKERAQVVTRVVFGLAECSEKERLTNRGPARSSRGYFMGTSNMSLAQLGREGGVFVGEAHYGRMTDIPMPPSGYGIFDTLHDFKSGEDLADALQRRSRQLYGTAGPEFVRKLIQEWHENPADLKRGLKRRRHQYKMYLRKKTKAEGLKPLNRSTGRCATAYAAGTTGIKYGLLPWKRNGLLRAISACQLDQLRNDQKAAVRPITVETLKAKLVTYLRENRRKFWDLTKKRPSRSEHKLGSAPGYRDKRKGKTWFYLTADQLDEVIGRGTLANEMKAKLQAEGLLMRGQLGRYVVQRRIYRGGKGNEDYARVYAFNLRLINHDGSA
jgi:putative DNA primase/helicase